jgi:DNA invertase Pin-like site-specific DNA recombinase
LKKKRRLKAVSYASTDTGPLSEREGLQRLLKAANNKEFEAVIVDSIHRFGSAEEITTVYKHLQSHGIKLIDQIGEVTDDVISKLTD